MKGLYFLFIGLIMVAVFACASTRQAQGVPACIQAKIDSLKAEPVQNPPASVYEYDYMGKKVYWFNAPCCDQFDKVFTADCQYLCAPSGGFTGRGDGKCPDFKNAATGKKLIWKDPRGK